MATGAGYTSGLDVIIDNNEPTDVAGTAPAGPDGWKLEYYKQNYGTNTMTLRLLCADVTP